MDGFLISIAWVLLGFYLVCAVEVADSVCRIGGLNGAQRFACCIAFRAYL
jgi:hypothetical protein